MGGTLVIPALPFIAKDFNLNSSESSWVFIGYEVMLIVGSVVYGKLAQAFKLRTLLYVCIVLTTIGGILALFSTNLLLLILARVIQGIALGAPITLSMLIINQYFPKKEQKKGLTYIALAISLGTGLSPIIGGTATSLFGWKSIFIIIASMIVLMPFIKWIPDNKIEKVKIPYGGICLLSFSFFLLLFGIHGHVTFIGLSVLSWVLFGLVNKKGNSLINLTILKNKTVLPIIILNLFLMLAINSVFFLTPIYLDELYNLSSIQIGLILFPGAILSALSIKLIGHWSLKMGSIPFLTLSLVVLIIGFLSLFFAIGHSIMYTSFAFLFIYVGFAAFQSELSNFTSTQTESNVMSDGVGMSNLLFFTGATFGPALTGLFIDEGKSINSSLITLSPYHLAVIGMVMILVIMFLIITVVIRKEVVNVGSNLYSTRR